MTADTAPIVLKTQHGFLVSYLKDDKCNVDDLVQFYFNGKFRFAIEITDLLEIVEKLKEKP